MKFKIPPIRILAQVSLAAIVLKSFALAQSTSFLEINTIEFAPGVSTEFTFSDLGSGATNYTVEFLPSVDEGQTWSILDGAAITDLGSGNYHVVAHDSEDFSGFYRVRANGGAVVASFESTAFQVAEGGTVAPTLRFNAAFFGSIHYVIGGTAESGDYVELSGDLRVDGVTAAIPVEILENAGIGELKHLSLSLIDGLGYRVGASSQTTIVIDDNDAEWSGSFGMENAAITFVLKIQQTEEGQLAWLKSDGFGFFPTNELPASLSFTESTFAATVPNIPFNPDASLIDSAINLSFSLSATDAEPGQSVDSTQVLGAGTLITEVPGQSHLNATNHGTFILVKPRTAPSTNQVELVPAL